uniref:Uncharacterized protein n=1 Tax=Rhizophora mucronata TaxID=61149 RepID=A0A2P2PP95_RHIMU
MLPSGDSML